jgi:hypothetical protein
MAGPYLMAGYLFSKPARLYSYRWTSIAGMLAKEGNQTMASGTGNCPHCWHPLDENGQCRYEDCDSFSGRACPECGANMRFQNLKLCCVACEIEAATSAQQKTHRRLA